MRRREFLAIAVTVPLLTLRPISRLERLLSSSEPRTINDVRRSLGMDYLSGGDVAFMPSIDIPAGHVGEALQAEYRAFARLKP